MAELTTIPNTYGFGDQSVLAAPLSSGETTIYVSPIIENEDGLRVTRGFATEEAFGYIELGGSSERFSYGTKTVDSTTKITTLTDVRRELSKIDGSDLTSKGDGFDWPKGAKIVVGVDPALFNKNATTDKPNTFEDTISFNEAPVFKKGTRNNPFADTTARDAYFTSPTNGDECFVTGLGKQYYNSGWQTVGVATVFQAADGTSGTIDVASEADMQNSVATDATSGGLNAITVGRTVVTPGDYTPAFLTGGSSAQSTAATWAALTNTGKFKITIDGTEYDDVNPDFTGDADMDDVAASIQTAIRADTSGSETVVWDTDHFVITSGDTTSTSAITVTSSPSTGTDISGAGASDWMDCDTGNGTVTAKSHKDKYKVPIVGADGQLPAGFLPNIPVSKFNDGINASSSTFLRGDGTWATPPITGDSDVFLSTRSTTDATGTVDIAHGMSGTPDLVLVSMRVRGEGSSNSAAYAATSTGSSNGTSNKCIYDQEANPGGTTFQLNKSSSYCIVFSEDNNNDKQEATITMDDTNVTLNWTKTGSPTAYTMEIILTVIKY